MEHHRANTSVTIEQTVKIEGGEIEEDAVIESQTLPDESNENQSIEIRSQNVIISSSEGKPRSQDGSEVQSSNVEGESSVGQIE